MRNKNAQNNGKDGEYGEGKNEKEKRAENRPRNFMETALAACDVTDVHIAKTFFGLDYCVVIEYGHNNIVTVQPDNEEAFMERIKNK